jgi:integrase
LDQATAAALGSLRTTQKKERLAWGPAWKDTGYVFILENGEPYHPERVSKLFAQATEKAKLPSIRLHDLRHTYATLALSVGIHPKVVSERLGHANIGITLDTYSHAVPALSEEAASRVAALVVPD